MIRRWWLTAFLIIVSAPAAAASLDDKLGSIEGFVDGVMAGQRAEENLVGATIALVKDNRLVLAKGYGEANRGLGLRVDARRTMFRIGSISKLFVWLGVMREVEAGRLALDADVNDYLGTFEIPLTQPGPVTLEHLMTHTPGFEDRLLGLFARGPRTTGDFHDRLITMRPKRVVPAGQLAAYSNYGAALAAHLVERSSGVAWDDFVDRQIFQPLGMVNATTRQPVPQEMRGQLAQGYVFTDGRFESVGFEFVVLPPAGSASASATDMARFMMAMLGRSPALLSRGGFDQLFSTNFTHDPRLNGIAHGFQEADSHGQHILGHGGDTIAFHSQLLLYPEHHMGLFVSYNSDRGHKALPGLVTALNDHLFGRPAPVLPPERVPATARYEGFYLMARSEETSPGKLLKLLGAVRVAAGGDGSLLVSGPLGARRFFEVDTDLFQELDGSQRIAFAVTDETATHLFVDSAPFVAFVRAEGLEHPLLNLAVVLSGFVVLSSMLLWPFSALSHANRESVSGEKRASLVAFVNGGLLIGFAIGLALQIDGPNEILFGLPKVVHQLMWLPVAAAVLAVLQWYFVYRAWAGTFWWWLRRVHYTLVAFAVVVLVVWMHQWRLTALTFVD